MSSYPERDGIIRDIKSRGYWEFRFHPDTYHRERYKPQEILGLIQRSAVDLRGWNFPHLGKEENGRNLTDGLERWCHWRFIREYWRMMTSGQFYRLFGLLEERYESQVYQSWGSQGQELMGKKWLSAVDALYELTEAFEFMKRLTSKELYYETWVADVTLHDVAGRHLAYGDFTKLNIIPEGLAIPSDPIWHFSKQEIVSTFQQESGSIALDAFQRLLHFFNWNNPPVHVFDNLQRKLLTRQL